MARKSAKPRKPVEPEAISQGSQWFNTSPSKYNGKMSSSIASPKTSSSDVLPVQGTTTPSTNTPQPETPIHFPTPLSAPPTKFVVYKSKEANGDESSSLNAHARASDIPLDQLYISSQQESEIRALYAHGTSVVDHIFDISDRLDQAEAMRLLEGYGVDEASRENMGNRWSIRWKGEGPKVGGKPSQRVLYQW